MLIRYSKFDDATKDRIRAIESRGHVGYVRYLLLRRWNPAKINGECLKLGLSQVVEEDLRMYFTLVMYPILQQYKLDGYYRFYRDGRAMDEVVFLTTFKQSEDDRIRFCRCIVEMEVEFFFANEILDYYGSRHNIPRGEDGSPVAIITRTPNLTEILNHPKRHIIEAMLIEGRTPKMIADELNRAYDIQTDATDILFYSSAFFKTKRRDLERTIDDLQLEIKQLKDDIYQIQRLPENRLSIGEKSTAIGNAQNKIAQLEATIKRLMGNHSHATFSAGVLEYAQIREMFSDVMIRSHRRYVHMDHRTEDDVVAPLKATVDMMAKATERIMALDERIQATTKKDVSQEMLEVITPSLERVVEEEREAFRQYYREFGGELPDDLQEDTEILGIDD